jgi:hypothetical protein
MANRFDALNDRLIHFIEAQRIFLVGTAGSEGRVSTSLMGKTACA